VYPVKGCKDKEVVSLWKPIFKTLNPPIGQIPLVITPGSTFKTYGLLSTKFNPFLDRIFGSFCCYCTVKWAKIGFGSKIWVKKQIV
jgi:hypothetical protein